MGNQFIMPGRVFYGENALANASDVIASLGKKALVVTGNTGENRIFYRKRVVYLQM